jgi:hypothetical protein
MNKPIVMASQTNVGGDADPAGIAQDITADDIRAVAHAPYPLEERKQRLRDMQARLEARTHADGLEEFQPMIRQIDDLLAALDSGGEPASREAVGMDPASRQDARAPDESS